MFLFLESSTKKHATYSVGIFHSIQLYQSISTCDYEFNIFLTFNKSHENSHFWDLQIDYSDLLHEWNNAQSSNEKDNNGL